eukprot:scaffold132161_cov30-Tisochrysis_lutea.AAC.2
MLDLKEFTENLLAQRAGLRLRGEEPANELCEPWVARHELRGHDARPQLAKADWEHVAVHARDPVFQLLWRRIRGSTHAHCAQARPRSPPSALPLTPMRQRPPRVGRLHRCATLALRAVPATVLIGRARWSAVGLVRRVRVVHIMRFGEAKVEELEGTPLEAAVGRLEVAVHEPAGVHVLQPRDNLQQQVERFGTLDAVNAGAASLSESRVTRHEVVVQRGVLAQLHLDEQRLAVRPLAAKGWCVRPNDAAHAAAIHGGAAVGGLPNRGRAR